MYLRAFEIAGTIPHPEEQRTSACFEEIMKAEKGLTLDEAILRFEHAPTGQTLDEFAQHKGRLAEGYRRRFKPYYDYARYTQM